MRGLCFLFALLSLRAVAQKADIGKSDDLPPPPSSYRNPDRLGQVPLETIAGEYTGEARLAGLEGSARFLVAINGERTPFGLPTTQPMGLGLDEKALEAVAHWRGSAGARQPMFTSIAVEFLLPAKQSRWHLTHVQFNPPEGTTRPVFVSAKYPLGSGIALELGETAIDEARILAAVGRQAWAVVSFDVDESGFPRNFAVDKVSADVWKNQAIAVVREWRFTPGMKDGKPIAVRCTLDLVWGQRDLPTAALTTARPEEPKPRTVNPATSVFLPGAEPGVTRIAVSSDEQALRLIQRVAPKSQQILPQSGRTGVVDVRVLIGTDGHVRRAVAVDRTAILAGDAIEAVKQWVYQPAIVNGTPVEVVTIVAVEVPVP